MSENIELRIFGQILRLNCAKEQHEPLKQSLAELEQRVAEMKERTGIIQLERILTIVALNLNYELNEQKQKNNCLQEDFHNRIQALNTSLAQCLIPSNNKTGGN